MRRWKSKLLLFPAKLGMSIRRYLLAEIYESDFKEINVLIQDY